MPHYTLYFDDSGSRHPDKKPDKARIGRDWFALGGYMVRKEDDQLIRDRHAQIVERWGVRSPFHMTDMLSNQKGFSWLGRISAVECDRFWREYVSFLAGLPVVGIACVISRPGYLARGYLEQYGKDKWLLCRSAFDITVERSVKFARLNDRQLKVVFESDPGVNETMKGYFGSLKAEGLAFDKGRSGKYKPLSQEDFADTLLSISHKPKAHPMLQIADSYIYSIARQKYDSRFWIHRHLRDARKLANFVLPNEHLPEMGIKYYCFDPPNTKKPG